MSLYKEVIGKIKNVFVKPSEEAIREKIAKRAYELYEKRGCQGGHEAEDWLKAEEEILKKKPRKK